MRLNAGELESIQHHWPLPLPRRGRVVFREGDVLDNLGVSQFYPQVLESGHINSSYAADPARSLGAQSRRRRYLWSLSNRIPASWVNGSWLAADCPKIS